MPVETATVHPRGNPGEVGGRGPADHVVSASDPSILYRDLKGHSMDFLLHPAPESF